MLTINLTLSVCLVCTLSYLSSSPHMGASKLYGQGCESTAGYTFIPYVMFYLA